MADQNRNFVGSGKRVKDYDLVNISICLSDIPEGAKKEYKGKIYLNLTIGGKKGGADQYGKTHSVWLNEFVPKKAEKSEYDNDMKDINSEEIPY